MIKTYSEFINKAKEKFGENTFTYLKDTFTFYTKPMTIIHNDSGLKFEMTPEMHIKSKTGISKDVIYKLKEPFDEFCMFASLYYNTYEPIEETYRGYSRAVVVEDINTCKRYYVKAGDLVHPRKHVEFISVDEVERMKEVISKYKKRVDFYAAEPELNEKIKKNGLYFLLDGLDWKPDRIEYSEEYLRNHLLEYKNAGKSRSLFVKENGREHSYMRRHNLIHLYYECGLSAASELPQGIYACEFHLPEGNYAYIGLTYNFSEREADHRGADPHSTPCKFIKEHNLDKNDMIFKILLDIDDCKNPSEMEEYYRQKYEKEGWIILNAAPTGARGHRHIIVESREDVEKFVKKHNITTAARLYHDSRDMYRYAEKNGFLNEIVSVGYVKTQEEYEKEIEESFENCSNYTEWFRTYPKLYKHLCQFDKDNLKRVKEHYNFKETKALVACNIFNEELVLFALRYKRDLRNYNIEPTVMTAVFHTSHHIYKSFIKFKEIDADVYDEYLKKYESNIPKEQYEHYYNTMNSIFENSTIYSSLSPLLELNDDGTIKKMYFSFYGAGIKLRKSENRSKYSLYLEEFVYQKRRFKSISIEEMYRILAERNPELATLGNYFPC